jgi:hypothetical protein
MSEERDQDPQPPTGAAGTGANSGEAAGAGKGGATGAGSIDALRERVTEAASDFLKDRLGLERGLDGSLQFPERGAFENIGQRADQFVRGFFRGFVDKTPEEREVAAGLRDPKDVPSSTEIATRLLSKVSETMSGTFREYLKDHVVDPHKPDSQVVVDGRFVMRHGAPLIASFVQALGTRFNDKGAPANGPAEPSAEPPHVDYRVDLPSLFKSLFVRPAEGAPSDPPAPSPSTPPETKG